MAQSCRIQNDISCPFRKAEGFRNNRPAGPSVSLPARPDALRYSGGLSPQEGGLDDPRSPLGIPSPGSGSTFGSCSAGPPQPVPTGNRCCCFGWLYRSCSGTRNGRSWRCCSNFHREGHGAPPPSQGPLKTSPSKIRRRNMTVSACARCAIQARILSISDGASSVPRRNSPR